MAHKKDYNDKYMDKHDDHMSKDEAMTHSMEHEKNHNPKKEYDICDHEKYANSTRRGSSKSYQGKWKPY